MLTNTDKNNERSQFTIRISMKLCIDHDVDAKITSTVVYVEG